MAIDLKEPIHKKTALDTVVEVLLKEGVSKTKILTEIRKALNVAFRGRASIEQVILEVNGRCILKISRGADLVLSAEEINVALEIRKRASNVIEAEEKPSIFELYKIMIGGTEAVRTFSIEIENDERGGIKLCERLFRECLKRNLTSWRFFDEYLLKKENSPNMDYGPVDFAKEILAEIKSS